MGDALAETLKLPAYRVDVVEPGRRSQSGWVRCEIGENLEFDTAGLAAYCLADWDERVYDAFVLAAAVQFCDHTKSRPSMGWGRDLELRVPVHEPEHWNSAQVSGALHDVLSFLTGDRWQIMFTARQAAAPSPPQGQFAMPDGSRVVTPYSDGLDSRAVAGLMEQEYGHKLIRVRLGSRALTGRQNGVRRTPFALVPYRVRYGNRRSVETSARSRGFKFTLLSGIAAYLSRARQIVITESGQGALGPTLVPVGQAYEDYRNHPLFTDRMEALLLALFGHKVTYTYPRLWHTKAETLEAFVNECSDGAHWAETRSCWQGQRQVSVCGRMRQCGICAACLLRRMSVHAAGLNEDDETYVWENLGAVRFEDGVAAEFKIRNPRGAMYEYAIAGTLHLDHLADLLHSTTNQAVIGRRVFQLSRSLGLSMEVTRAKLERLLGRHETEWKSFVSSLGPKSFVAQWALTGD